MVQLEAKDHCRPLAERERFLAEVRERVPRPGVCLQTCNRVEIYSGEGEVPPETARHLFRVAAGLESRLLGETAVLGQVRQAYRQAAAEQSLPAGLHRLFQAALKAGKRVRAETRLARGAVSHGQAVMELLLREQTALARARVTILGVNHLNRTIIKYLAAKACRTVFVSTRSFAKALALSRELGCRAFTLENLSSRLQETDVLISATSAPHALVRYDRFPRHRPMLIIDLAVPRDVDEAVGSLPGVRLYNLTDVEDAVLANRRLRRGEIREAEKIIAEEVEVFLHAQTSR